VLDTATIRDNGDFLDGLAAQFDGEYDGWKASVRSPDGL
jgi:hypothetical protein